MLVTDCENSGRHFFEMMKHLVILLSIWSATLDNRVTMLVIHGPQTRNTSLLDSINEMEAFMIRNVKGDDGISLRSRLDQIKSDFQKKIIDEDSLISGVTAQDRIKHVLDHVNSRLHMFKSHDTTVSAAAISVLLYDIGPLIGTSFGFTPPILRDIFSGLFGLISADKIVRIFDELIEDALGGKLEEKFKRAALSLRDLLQSFKTQLDDFRGNEKKVSISKLSQLTLRIERFSRIEFIDLLSLQIQQGVQENSSAVKLVAIIALFSELGKLIDVYLLDAFNTITISGRLPKTTVAILNTRNEILSNFKDAVQFLRLQGEGVDSEIEILSQFYPPRQSSITKQIDKFLDYLQIPKVTFLPEDPDIKYQLTPKRFPFYTLCGYRHLSVKNLGSISEDNDVRGCSTKAHPSLKSRLIQDEDGFYEILVSFNKKEGNLVAIYTTQRGDRVQLNFGPEEPPSSSYLKFRLVPVNAEEKLFSISPKKRPGKFLFMEGGRGHTIRLSDGDPDQAGYWTAKQ